ncbi:DEAD/DEAH box helicase [Alphaproteobacteria bacterium]|jgi:superfamily II DNA/RNA helicase|nr:DEAD/DEAH box helicase [Alphaproteobacteria bacterium]
MTSFADLGLSDTLLKSIKACGYENPTPIQEKSIPIILMGRDVLGSAQTGTGKTASFTLPMIDILDAGRAKARLPRSLILTPTRELAAQVSESFNQFSQNHGLTKALLIGGVSFGEQDALLDRGVDVLIATPGRLLDHLERGKVLLRDVKILVIDEADRMLDMGFIPDVEKITKLLPKIRQTLFFSATLNKTIYKISENFVINPKIIEISPEFTTADTVEQFVCHTTPRKKHDTLRQLITSENVANAFIFCNRKRDIATLKTSLNKNGMDAECLHGDMSQSARNAALTRFKNNEVKLLVASDVAARGIDIAGLSHVFNFDVPSNPEDYVHRIGRTGRAGNLGKAFSLVANDDDKSAINAIEKLIGKTIPSVDSGNTGKTTSKKPNKSAENTTNAEPASTAENSATEKSPTENSIAKNVAQDTARTDAKPSPRRKKPTRYEGERDAPPDCSGSSFKETEHTPAFLLNQTA